MRVQGWGVGSGRAGRAGANGSREGISEALLLLKVQELGINFMNFACSPSTAQAELNCGLFCEWDVCGVAGGRST